MAKTSHVPRFVRVANVLTTTLLRAGVPLVGPGLIIGMKTAAKNVEIYAPL